MTEDQIERRVEKMMDHLDRVFMAGQMDQKAYDAAVKDLDEWADLGRRIEAGDIFIGRKF